MEKIQQTYPFKLDIREARGEEIPELVAEAAWKRYPVIGITGQDLAQNEFIKQNYWEWADSNVLGTETLGLSFTGPYSNSVFGLPALCVMQRGKGTLTDRAEKINFERKRVVIPERYSYLINTIVPLKEAEVMSREGKVDITAATDNTIDYAIDIVLTGRTMRENDLGIVSCLTKSDGILLYNGTAKYLERKLS